jgi:hypothetical protein
MSTHGTHLNLSRARNIRLRLIQLHHFGCLHPSNLNHFADRTALHLRSAKSPAKPPPTLFVVKLDPADDEMMHDDDEMN